MLPIRVEADRIGVGARFSVAFQRTLRIPDDGRTYPLPPGLGRLPIHAVAEYGSRVPEEWRREGGFFVPLYQREALWLGFDGADWKPNAVKIGIGRINAVSGEPWRDGLHSAPQDYIVCPDQPWLDGINAGAGEIRQFVAMPLGAGYSVEEQLTGAGRFGGIQIVVYEPKEGRFPDEAPPAREGRVRALASMPAPEMGIAAGGRMKQKIYPDRYGLDVWDQDTFGKVAIHIVNSDHYMALTGRPPPPTPISAAAYTEHGLPWFDLYDESRSTLGATASLSGVKSVGEIDQARPGEGGEGEQTIDVSDGQVVKLVGSRNRKDDD